MGTLWWHELSQIPFMQNSDCTIRGTWIKVVGLWALKAPELELKYLNKESSPLFSPWFLVKLG